MFWKPSCGKFRPNLLHLLNIRLMPKHRLQMIVDMPYIIFLLPRRFLFILLIQIFPSDLKNGHILLVVFQHVLHPLFHIKHGENMIELKGIEVGKGAEVGAEELESFYRGKLLLEIGLGLGYLEDFFVIFEEGAVLWAACCVGFWDLTLYVPAGKVHQWLTLIRLVFLCIDVKPSLSS